jgi:hypothetical protein
LAASFAEPSGTNIVSAFDLGGGVLELGFNALCDHLPETDDLPTGVEYRTGGTWTPFDYIGYYRTGGPGGLTIIDAGLFEPIDLVGLEWRLVPPISSFTVEGQPVSPTSGIIAAAPPGLAAKIAEDRLLTSGVKNR